MPQTVFHFHSPFGVHFVVPPSDADVTCITSAQVRGLNRFSIPTKNRFVDWTAMTEDRLPSCVISTPVGPWSRAERSKAAMCGRQNRVRARATEKGFNAESSEESDIAINAYRPIL
jgi:hypothetical protein